MNAVPAREVYRLDGAIVPQLFIERDGDIYFFDKINLHEGRFCRFQRGEVKIVLEVGEGQGVISHRGEIYLLQIGVSTVISKFKLDGQLEKTISVDGIFFDFKLNESGYFVLLGYVDNKTIVKILNCNGLEAGFFNPKNILFGSCIGLYNDDIYLGGFDDNNLFMLLSMNYIGNIQNGWSIAVDSGDRIISKIQRDKNYILLHIVGKYDSLVVLNPKDGRFNEILPCDLGLKSFIDVNICGEEIQILDEKCIYTWNINDVLNISRNIKSKGKNENFNPLSYQYLMYMKGLEREILSSLKITLIIMLIIFIFFFYNKTSVDVKFGDIFLLVFSCFWFLNTTIAALKNLIGLLDKSKRIDELLNIYSMEKERSLRLPLFMGLTFVSFCILFLYPDFSVYPILSFGALFSILTYAVKVKLIKDVIMQNENVRIELLNFEESRFGEYLRTVIETLKDKNCEDIFVNLKLKKRITKGIIERWIASRKTILGIIPKIYISDNIVKLEIDFSERDIKYSRYSILMDYICYIERETDIEEIQIGLVEDKG